MQIRIFFSALNIDDIGKRWGVRIFFALLTVANFFVYMNPLGDSDFTAFFNWYQDYLTNPQMYLLAPDVNFPISEGNIIFLLYRAATMLGLIIVALIYASVFVYSKRADKDSVSKGLVIKRTILMILFVVLLFPILLLFISGMSFLFVAAMPILSMVVCAYMSGDQTFGKSFAFAFRNLRREFFSAVLNFMIGFLVVNLLSSGVDMFNSGNAYFSIVCVLAAALDTYTYFALGRLMGTIYLDSKGQIPFRIKIKKSDE